MNKIMKTIWNLSYKNKLWVANLSMAFAHVLLFHFNSFLVPYILTNKLARMNGLFTSENIFFVNGTDEEVNNYFKSLP